MESNEGGEMTTKQIADLVRAEQEKGLDYAQAAAKVSRDNAIKGGEVMRAVMAERDK